MGKMAVEHPIAHSICHELDIPCLSHTDECRVPARPDCLRLPRSFASRLPEREAVQMNRMVIHAEVDNSDANALTVANDQGCRSRACLTIEREPVELHVHAVRNRAVRQNGVFLESDEIVLIDS